MSSKGLGSSDRLSWISSFTKSRRPRDVHWPVILTTRRTYISRGLRLVSVILTRFALHGLTHWKRKSHSLGSLQRGNQGTFAFLSWRPYSERHRIAYLEPLMQAAAMMVGSLGLFCRTFATFLALLLSSSWSTSLSLSTALGTLSREYLGHFMAPTCCKSPFVTRLTN